MTGPDHYDQAERLLARAEAVEPTWATLLLAEAQVHATLALTMATLHDMPYTKAWGERVGSGAIHPASRVTD